MPIHLDKLDIPLRNSIKFLLKFINLANKLLKYFRPLRIIHPIFILPLLILMHQLMIQMLPFGTFLLHYLIIFLPYIYLIIYYV